MKKSLLILVLTTFFLWGCKNKTTHSSGKISQSIERPDLIRYYAPFFNKAIGEFEVILKDDYKLNNFVALSNFSAKKEFLFSKAILNNNEYVFSAEKDRENYCVIEPSSPETVYDEKAVLFGKKNRFVIEGSSRSGEVLLDETLYFPKPLNASMKVRGGVEYTDIHRDKQECVIKWDADPLNKNGVLVVVHYSGHRVPLEENENLTNIPKGVTEVLNIVDDDGSYTLQKGDLIGVPPGGIFHVILYRGDFKFVDVGQSLPVKICAYETHNFSLFIKD